MERPRPVPAAADQRQTIAGRLLRFDESGREPRARARQAAGDFRGALADWRRAAPAIGAPTTAYVALPGVTVRGLPGIPVEHVDPVRVGAAAIAAALAGKAGQACDWLAAAQATAATLKPPTEFIAGLGVG